MMPIGSYVSVSCEDETCACMVIKPDNASLWVLDSGTRDFFKVSKAKCVPFNGVPVAFEDEGVISGVPVNL